MKQKLALIYSLFFLSFSAFAVETVSHSVSQAAIETSSCEIKPENGENGEYSSQQLQTLAKRITVKVIGDDNGGSGTLLAKKGNTYLVLTNFHVVRGVNSISLKTSDGKTYPAQIVTKTNFEKFDLALLQFQTNQNYCLPNEIVQSIPDTNTSVIAAGYSSDIGQIVFRTGIVQQIAPRPLKEGYSIGYTSDIEQGMSGGAILNSHGELIGINGRSAYPILNTGYTYPDGSRPTEEEIKRMRSVSWGIPVSTVLEQVHPEILTAYSLPLPTTPPSIPETKLTGWLGDLEQKAKKFTVRIDRSIKENGSGIIIAQNGDTYTVLTASHVVCKTQDAKQPCGNYNYSYKILAPDGKQYPVDKSTIKVESGVDLAVVKFRASNQNYQVATLANYNPRDRQYIFTAGYPKLGDNYSPWRLTMGQIFDKEQGLIQSTQSDFQSNSSGKLKSASSLRGGYELVYTNITYGGMSGGPVLDSLGRVIGIHGRAEGETALYEKTGDTSSSKDKVQIGYSLGIPVSTFFGIATRLGVLAQKVENTATPQLDAQQVKSIKQAVLSTDVSKGNTKAKQWLERGNQLWRLLRYQEAVSAFDSAIKLKPDFTYLAYYGKGLALADDGKYLEAQAALESAVQLKDNFVAGWQILSRVYRSFKQLEKALGAIDKAIQLEQNNQQQPLNPNLYNEKYAVLEGLKRYAQAELAINKAIKIAPRAAFFTNLGNLYYEQKKWELALNNYNKAIAINPTYDSVYNNLGLLYYEQKKWELALTDYNKAIAINPTDASVYNNRGLLYYEQKKWELALTDYNKAIAINHQVAQAYYNRGNVYSKQKKWELALTDYNKAIAINPTDTDAYINRGIFYSEQKKWKLALNDYNKALAINPNFADAYNYRGVLYSKQKKWDLALNDYNKALAINPNDANAYINRGVFYSEQKKWELALNDYNKALAINPNDANAYNYRGVLYSKQKKWELALNDYNKALAINPTDANVYYNRGVLYSKQKKWDLALNDYNKALAINHQLAQAYYNRGLLYYEQKKWELALSDYNKAIAINPTEADAYGNRGLVYAIMGNKQKAIQDLQQAAQLFQAQGKSADYEQAMNILKELQR